MEIKKYIMFAKKITPKITKKDITHYKFHIHDPVLCVIKDCIIKDAIILSRNTINGENFYKIGNKQSDNDQLILIKVCKERELIHR